MNSEIKEIHSNLRGIRDDVSDFIALTKAFADEINQKIDSTEDSLVRLFQVTEKDQTVPNVSNSVISSQGKVVQKLSSDLLSKSCAPNLLCVLPREWTIHFPWIDIPREWTIHFPWIDIPPGRVLSQLFSPSPASQLSLSSSPLFEYSSLSLLSGSDPDLVHVGSPGLSSAEGEMGSQYSSLSLLSGSDLDLMHVGSPGLSSAEAEMASQALQKLFCNLYQVQLDIANQLAEKKVLEKELQMAMALVKPTSMVSFKQQRIDGIEKAKDKISELDLELKQLKKQFLSSNFTEPITVSDYAEFEYLLTLRNECIWGGTVVFASSSVNEGVLARMKKNVPASLEVTRSASWSPLAAPVKKRNPIPCRRIVGGVKHSGPVKRKKKNQRKKVFT